LIKIITYQVRIYPSISNILKTSNRHQESPDPISVTQLELSVPGLDPGHQACLPRITEDIQQASRITRPDFSDTARIIRF
jgi:hypothetical protein